MRYLFCLVITVFLVQCNSSTNSDSNQQAVVTPSQNSLETIYMCQCHEGNDQQSDTLRMTKKVYVYLVQSENIPDCCTNKLVEGYDAYIENWSNNRPGTSNIIWSLNDHNIDTLTATEAMNLACAMQEKTFGVTSVKIINSAFQKYYPELVENK